MSRTKNTILNAVVGVIGQLVVLLLQFLNRNIFIVTLGRDYLGTNGLFSDILSMLSVAELGLGTAIIFAMYKPMAEGDNRGLAKLVRFYRSAYFEIGSIFLGVGILLTPFLRYLIKDGGSGVEHLQIIYLLVLVNSAIGYFFSYKVTLITVAQKSYISSLVTICFKVLQSVAQIVILLLTHNYILYLCVQVLCTVGTNLVCSWISTKKFRDVFAVKDAQLSKEEKKGLFRNVKALLLHRMGSFFVNGTDNIIISKFLGLAVSGVYSNYKMVLMSVCSFVTPVFDGLTASVGNLNVLESREKNKRVFEKVNFMAFWIACFCCCCFSALMNPFIYLLSGNDASYLVELPVLGVIILNFYLSQMRTPVLTFKNAMGLYWQDRWKPLIEAAINIAVSLFLVEKIGFIGVLIGTSISTVSVVIAVEPYVVYKYGFEMSVKSYFRSYAEYLAVTAALCCITYKTADILIAAEGWIGIFERLAICLILPNLLLFLIYHRTEEFRYFVEILMNFLGKRISGMASGRWRKKG